jgi:glutamine cyclotransferase
MHGSPPRRFDASVRAAAVSALVALGACAQAAPTQAVAAETPRYGYRIVRTYPHDPRAFTQGLIHLDGHLYESTGLIGESTIRKVNLADGKVLKSVPIPPGHFGEGMVNWGNELISITWQTGKAFRWDRQTLRRRGDFSYPGEGWGLTQNGRELIMSDGTPQLRFLDPSTFRERRRVQVTYNGKPLPNLNELEWVNGEIFANIWQTEMIARIDPQTGNVIGLINLAGLRADAGRSGPDNVLNGIAYDAKGDRLLVTGKRWPKLYEIRLTKAR